MAKELERGLPHETVQKAESVLKRAEARELRLATAESCTGGSLASLLTDVEGVSHVFERGLVTYSDEAKCDLLGIERELVEDCGAVSKDVAIAMAKGALARSRADLAISITGFAGPAGDDDEEGLVHFALAVREGKITHREEHFGAIGRDGVRCKSLETALDMFDKALG